MAKCATCGERIFLANGVRPADELWQHDNVCRLGQPASPVTQLPGVTFHEQALLAIRSLAVTGEPFTVGHAHPMVAIPPTNPRTDWEVARKDAERLGLIEWTGEYADSIVPSTKGSAVKVWRGTWAAVHRRGAA